MTSLNRSLTVVLSCYLCVIMGCAQLPNDARGDKVNSHYLVSENSTLGTSLVPLASQHPNQSGFFALQHGIDALAARLALIDQATTSLDVQYYIWHDDYVGRALFLKLFAAADRGVRVRLLLDDFDTKGKDEILNLLQSHNNIELRLFNPFVHRQQRWMDFLFSARRLNHRMHNKSLTADTHAAIIGGRNIGKEYFAGKGKVEFEDMDVIAVGPVVREIATAFDTYWNSESVYRYSALVAENSTPSVSRKELEASLNLSDHAMYVDVLKSVANNFTNISALPFEWGHWVLGYDDPDKVNATQVSQDTHLAPNLKRAADASQQELIIVSPYFVPGKNFTQYLIDKVASGVEVKILTNSLAANDVSLVHAGYRRYRKDLVDAGVELYEFKPTKALPPTNEHQRSQSRAKQETGKPLPEKKSQWLGASNASLHAKFFAFDKKAVFVGSFNLDARSIELNTEMGVYFESEKYAEAISHSFDETIEQRAYRIVINNDDALEWHTIEEGLPVVYQHEPHTSWWQRFSNRIMSFIVPEKQL